MLAARGHYSIVGVIVVASLAAIIGDNIGYWLGRKAAAAPRRDGSRARAAAERVLPPAERFFERHGGKTVFLARFFAVLRVTAAWIAGMAKMPWWRFFLWNAAGGIGWAVAVGLVATTAATRRPTRSTATG